MTEQSVLLEDAGHRALADGDLMVALEAFEGALEAEDTPELRVVAAGLRLSDDDFDGARLHWEAAFDLYRRAENPQAAARVAAMLADLHAVALGNEAASRGWIYRGRRLLAPVGRCVELGYLELAVVSCIRDDATEVERSADLALSLAMEFHDPELELRALADSGLALVSQGREVEGFARLDEALATMVTGQVQDLDILGRSLCALLSACDRAGDLPRAEETTRLARTLLNDRFNRRPRVLHAHCGAAYGSVLCDLGRWPEAEEVLSGAMGDHGSASDYHRMLTSCHLAELRILQGRLTEAADLLRPYEGRSDSFHPSARLRLMAGELELAGSLAVAGIAALRGDLVRSVPLWSVLVSVRLACDDVVAARAAADELARLTRHTGLPAVRAEALLAAGRVALTEGEFDDALGLLQQARANLDQECRPMLRAGIAHALAQALAGSGQREMAVIEARGALETFCTLGAQPDIDRTSALLRELGAPTRSNLGDGELGLTLLTVRERQVLGLLGEGLTNHQIAQRLFVSTKTTEHHVSRILSKLGVANRAQAAAAFRHRGGEPLSRRLEVGGEE